MDEGTLPDPEKHPEALMVFQMELRLEKERERHRRATFERLVPSAYIGQRTDTTVQRETTGRAFIWGLESVTSVRTSRPNESELACGIGISYAAIGRVRAKKGRV